MSATHLVHGLPSLPLEFALARMRSGTHKHKFPNCLARATRHKMPIITMTIIIMAMIIMTRIIMTITIMTVIMIMIIVLRR